MKTAVVTLVIGDTYEKLARLTHPSIKAYAEKIGAEFHVIKERKYQKANPDKDVHPGYEKLQLAEYLDNYDRIIYFDTDLIIRPDTPNLFQFVPMGMFSAFNEGGWERSRLKSFVGAQHMFGMAAPASFKDSYYNTGVMVFDKSHKEMFKQPPEFIHHFSEQSWLNLMLARYHVDIRNLHIAYNRMTLLEDLKAIKDHRLESYVIHYAGALGMVPYEALAERIKEDLRSWKQLESKNYVFSKSIKISISGGLGDQIEAEPTVREIARLYPHDKIYVASHWPELFENLPYGEGRIIPLDIRKHFIQDEIYSVFHTYSPPSDDAWSYMTHVFCHSADFSSNLALRRVLPPEKKDIQIRYTPSEELNMYAKANVMPGFFDDAVLVHPGKSWRTKTLPPKFWEEVVDLLLEKKRKVVIFGKDGKTQGLVKFNFDKEKVLDLREKFSIKESLALIDKSKVLLSNDSAPIHMAGATDIWIVGIYTAKHPNFVIPFRKGTQEYKSIQVQNKPKCWPCNVDAVTTCLDEIRADYCTNLDNLYACFPSAKEASNAVEQAFQLDIG